MRIAGQDCVGRLSVEGVDGAASRGWGAWGVCVVLAQLSRTVARPAGGSPAADPGRNREQRSTRASLWGILYSVTDTTTNAAELDGILASIFLSPEGKADPYPGYATVRETTELHC